MTPRTIYSSTTTNCDGLWQQIYISDMKVKLTQYVNTSYIKLWYSDQLLKHVRYFANKGCHS